MSPEWHAAQVKVTRVEGKGQQSLGHVQRETLPALLFATPSTSALVSKEQTQSAALQGQHSLQLGDTPPRPLHKLTASTEELGKRYTLGGHLRWRPAQLALRVILACLTGPAPLSLRAEPIRCSHLGMWNGNLICMW